MRILLQRVDRASVTINGEKHCAINRGVLLFVGLTHGDNIETLRKMADKVVKLRIFEDEKGKTNKSIFDVDGSILSVSQFTLYGNAKEGNRPSFVEAMGIEEARALYELWVNLLKERYAKVESGVFQADMKVEFINDGPFTLILDSKELFKL